MRRSNAIALGALTVAVLNAAATVEAFRTGHPGLATVSALAVVGAVSVALLARRPSVELRGDLAAWTSRVAAATGERETDVVNRAVARHRAALDGEERPDG